MRFPSSFFLALFALVFSFSLSVPGASAATLSVQNVQPTTGISAGTSVSFYAAANGFVDPTFSVSDSAGASGSIDKFGYFSWVPTIDNAGLHTFTVTATDASGATAHATATIYVIPNTISIENLRPGEIAYTREPVTFTVHTPGFTNPWFYVRDTYAGTSVSAANLASDGSFTWSPATNEQGLHKLTVTAQDAYGHQASVSQAITVMPPTLAIGSVSPGTAVMPGTTVTFAASTVGLTAPSYSVVDSLGRYSTLTASNLSSTTGAFSWTPATSDTGTHTLTLTATGQYGGSASTKLVLVVGTTASPASATTAAAASSPAPAATSGVTAQNRYTFTTYLGVGSKGAAVTALQNLLTELGNYSGPVTGYFGPLTAAGVKSFQKTYRIEQVGFVGPQTRAALNAR